MSSILTANGLDVIEGVVKMPRVGSWRAEISVDTDAAITGPVSLAFSSGLRLAGTAARGGTWLETAFLRVDAGAGGMGRDARAAHYKGVSIRAVLLDLARASGDTLSPTIAESVLTTRVPFWTATEAVGIELTELCDGAGVGWRFLPDGTLWVGAETWPDSGLTEPIDYQDLGEHPQAALAELGIESPVIVPGTLLGGRQVSYVEHRVRAGAVRSVVWFEA